MAESGGPLSGKTEKALEGIGIAVLVALVACAACAVVTVIVLAYLGPAIGGVGTVIAPDI